MDINPITEEYNTRLSIRDSLPIAKSELEELEEYEEVQRYIRLKHYLDEYSSLENQSDQEILDAILSQVPDLELEDDIYFCFGKNFNGFLKMIGGYYIAEKVSPIRLNPGIKVAKYKSLSRIQEEIIIPTDETGTFEQEHQIYNHQTKDPNAEYLELRRKLFMQKMKQNQEENIKRLRKGN